VTVARQAKQRDGSESPIAGRRVRGLDAAQREAQRRDQLLDAAIELFASKGYPNVSIEQICKTAYVSTKSFYELFDGKEACYLTLFERIVAKLEARMEEALLAAPPPTEPGGVDALIAAFVRALVEDPRVPRVAFGESRAISPAVERQRRANRRWAATFMAAVWERYGITTAPGHGSGEPRVSSRVDSKVDPHRIAVGAIGGMFDLVADWLQDADPTSSGDVESLVVDLTAFIRVVGNGLADR
jgi:AcrR family transcriptional regulator